MNRSTGWFSGENPGLRPKPSGEIPDLCFKVKNSIWLVNDKNHYNYLSFAAGDIPGIVESQPIVECGENSNNNNSGMGNKYKRVVGSESFVPVLVLPFISDQMVSKIREEAFKLFPDPPFRISYKTSVNAKQFFEKNQKLLNMQSTEMLKKVGAIYKMTCKICESKGVIESYVGETGRSLTKRIKEHTRTLKKDKQTGEFLTSSADSRPVIHACEVHRTNGLEQWEVQVLGTSTSTQARKIMEAEVIRDHRPSLNTSHGLSLII
jgi:hypothetical protein